MPFVCIGLTESALKNAAIFAGMQAIAHDFNTAVTVCSGTFICIGLTEGNEDAITARVQALGTALDVQATTRSNC